MKWKLILAAGLVATQVNNANAIIVNTGDTVRDSYMLSGAELQPATYFLSFGSDLFDPGESISISLFDSSQNQLGLTRFDLAPTQIGGRTTFSLGLDRADFLPSGIGPFDPVRIPSAGFIEVTALAGAFDLTLLRLTASDRSVFPSAVVNDTLSDFSQIRGPAPVPLPVPLVLLLSAVLGLLGLGSYRRGRRGLPA